MAEYAKRVVLALQGAEEYFPALIADIDAAYRSVYLESYLVHDDPATAEVFEALIRARVRGVQVYLLLDGFGSAGQMDWIRRRLEPHGVRIELYRPGVRWLAPRTWRRLHRKLVLIDERVGYVGGINLIGDSYDLKFGTLAHPRLDFAVRVIADRAVSRISWAMRRLWWRVSLRNSLRALFSPGDRSAKIAKVRASWRRIRRHLRWRVPARRDASRRVRLILRDNLRFRRNIERWYLNQIEIAEREILIANAYFVPTLRFRLALLRAVARGVRVTLLLQGNSDQWWTRWATQALVRELASGGVAIYEYQPSFLHAKVAVIDSAVTIGSSNIDPFSLMMSLEANLVCENPAFAQHMRGRLGQAIAQSVAAAPAGEHPPGLRQRLFGWVALTFALTALRVFLAFSGTRLRVL